MNRKSNLLFVFIFLISIITHQAIAVPAVPWPVEKQQPDGSTIQVYIRGDEKVNWLESLDGYTLMYDSQKNIVYAELDAKGDMIPSKMIYGKQLRSAEKANLEKGIRYSSSQIQILKQIWEVGKSAREMTPVTGEKKALCVLVGFPDKPFSKTVEEFENLMNQEGYSANGASGSVKDFYLENSYGQLDLTVTVVGPFTTTHNLSYYAPEYIWRTFAREAIIAANEEIDITEFANDNNELETFHIIYAGYGDEAIGNGQQIWAHKWQLATPITLNGVQISVYSCSPELSGRSGTYITNIGVICHELCHVFGAPDYYDTNGSAGGSFNGTGNWDLMAGGSWNGNGVTPAHINMFQKILYGWVIPEELTAYTEVTGMPNSAENPVAYTFEANDNGELYVLENRRRIGFDIAVPGQGLLIYHVHQNALNGNVNNSTHPQQVYPVVASSTTAIPGSSPSSYGNINSSGAVFPGTQRKTAFTDITTPQAFSWATRQGIRKPVTEISESEGLISFTFMGAVAYPVTDINAGVVDNTVTLSWTSPSDDVVEYEISRDNTIIATTETVGFSEDITNNGTYRYCVVAVYDDEKKSNAVCIDAVVANSACKRVMNLTVDLEGNIVSLNWESGSDPEIVYHEDFENEFSVTWTTVDNDGDGYSWELSSDLGIDAITSQSYIAENEQLLAPDNWLISPPVALSGINTLSFMVKSEDNSYPDHYGVFISTTDNAIDSFSELLSETEPTGIWTNKRIDLSGYSGETVYLAFRHYDSNGGRAISIDDVMILKPSNNYNIYRNNELIAGNIENTSFSDKLEISGSYQYCIEAVNEAADCISERVCANDNVSFVFACVEITDLTVDVSDDMIMLDWQFTPATSDREPTFNVYRNNVLIAGEITGNHYEVQAGKPADEYCVTFVGAYCESALVCATFTGINNNTATAFNLYPNPVSDMLIVEGTTHEITAIRVSDMSGREIFAKSYEESSNANLIIPTALWNGGIYIIRITTARGEAVHKVMKK